MLDVLSLFSVSIINLDPCVASSRSFVARCFRRRLDISRLPLSPSLLGEYRVLVLLKCLGEDIIQSLQFPPVCLWEVEILKLVN